MNFDNNFLKIKKNIEDICSSYNSKIKKLEKEKEEWIQKDEYMTNFLYENNFRSPNELLKFIKKYKDHICSCSCISINNLRYEDIKDNFEYRNALTINSGLVDTCKQYKIEIQKYIYQISTLKPNKKNIEIYNKYIDIYKVEDTVSFFDNILGPVKNSPVKNIKLDFNDNIILKKIKDENYKLIEENKEIKSKLINNSIMNNIERKYMRLYEDNYVKYIEHLNYSWYSIRDDYDKIITDYSKKRESEFKRKNKKILLPEEYIQKKCPIRIIDKNKIDEKTNLLLNYNIEKFRNEYNLLNNSINCSIDEIVNKNMELNISKQIKHRIKNKLIRFSDIYKHIGNNLKYFKFNYSNLIDMKDEYYKIWIKYFKNFADNYFISKLNI